MRKPKSCPKWSPHSNSGPLGSHSESSTAGDPCKSDESAIKKKWNAARDKFVRFSWPIAEKLCWKGNLCFTRESLSMELEKNCFDLFTSPSKRNYSEFNSLSVSHFKRLDIIFVFLSHFSNVVITPLGCKAAQGPWRGSIVLWQLASVTEARRWYADSFLGIENMGQKASLHPWSQHHRPPLFQKWGNWNTEH